jgi:sarcosine oxidase
MEHTEVVVVGTGGVGSAALWHLARRGVRVVGLDRFPPAHDRGSSHGETRIIRLAYFEHPGYVPLLRRAYALWAELEESSGEHLYRQTGILEIGPPDGELVAGVRAAAAEHELAIEDVPAADFTARFPGFVLPDGMEALFEQQAGYLRVEQCVAAHLRVAEAEGADVRTGVTVERWRPDGGGVVVDTDQGRIAADRLVVTAGPWAADILGDLGLPLRVIRKPMFWFAADPAHDVDAGCPEFFYETPRGAFYGFPAVGPLGLKVAEHSGGEAVEDPLAVDRSLRRADLDAAARFLVEHLPGVDVERCTHHAVCMYTSTPDGHFVIDRHPEHGQVSFVAGLSGHGFKMANVLGEIMADHVTRDGTDLPVDFLSMSRFSG